MTTKRSAKNPDLQEKITRLSGELTKTAMSYGIWRSLYYEHPRHFRTVLSWYRDFFLPTRHGHLAIVVVNLANLFDRRKDVASLERVVHQAEKDAVIGGSVLADVRLLMSEARVIAKKVEVLRSGLYAHLSAHEDEETIFARAELSSEEIWTLIGLTRRILNAVSSSNANASHLPDDGARRDAEEDTLKILKILDADCEARIGPHR